MGAPPIVVFIGAMWRSGSTLLDLMLGQLPSTIAVGEVRKLWQKGIVEDRLCGCGRAFHACPFWTDVGRSAFGGWDRVDARRLAQVQRELDRARAVPGHLVRGIPGPSPDARSYTAHLRRVLEGVREVSGAEVIVDSSKSPGHALFLRATGVDLRLVHLVRDPRGVVYSKMRSEERRLARQGIPGESVDVRAWASKWLVYNAGVPLLLRGVGGRAFLRYEDLVREPQKRLRLVLRRAGLPGSEDLPASLGDRSIRLATHHVVYGNPMRLASGELPLVLDEAWRTDMHAADQRAVTVITAPMLWHYGYPVVP